MAPGFAGRKLPEQTLRWPRSAWEMQRSKTVHPREGEETQQQLAKDRGCGLRRAAPGMGGGS